MSLKINLSKGELAIVALMTATLAYILYINYFNFYGLRKDA